MGKKDKNKDKEIIDTDFAEEAVEKAMGAVKDEMRKIVSTAVCMLAALVALCLIPSCTVVTKEDEYSVIRQFGSIVRIEDSPGLSFKIPLIQKVTKIEKKILFYDIEPSDVITSDKKTMIADAYVLWKITVPEVYIKSLSGSKTNAEARLNITVYNALKNTISSMSQNEVILSRDGKIVASDIGDDEITNNIIVDDDETDDIIRIKSLSDEIRENLADSSGYGITNVKSSVKVLDLPESNKKAVYQRMISERQNIAASYEAQGKSAAQMIINTTDKEITIMKAQAEAQAESVIAEGEAEYMKILSDAYSDEQKSEFYSFVRSLDAAKESLKKSGNTLILDEKSPIAKIFYNK